ncbi:MAG: acetyl-CoA carboxylase biotin carboxyl carrier protein subunit [Paracoccaceae bacterium]
MNKVVLSSEISGSVWKIKCNVGDVIEEGQEVLIIESMKMEIPVISDFSGTVVSILVDEGEMINEDQKLVELHKKD